MIKKLMYLLCCGLILLVSCEKEGSDSIGTDSSSDEGKGGSLARFTIAGDYLYAVDNKKLKTFDISVPSQPVLLKEILVGFGIETLFKGQDNILFLGSQVGLYIYDITDPTDPTQICYYQHIYSCDPVVASDSFAYVTLRSGNSCGRSTNELQVIDITDLSSPFLVNSYPMDTPKGLGLDGKELFVCDDGLKVYDASDASNLKLKHKFNVSAIDVIPSDTILMVLAADGLVQYKYKDSQIKLLSKLLTK